MATGTIRTLDFLVNTSFASNTTGQIGFDDTQDAAESLASMVTSGSGVKTASYTALITDRGNIVPFNVASGGAIYTIPTHAAVALPVNCLLGLLWVKTGVIQPSFGPVGGSPAITSSTGTQTARAAGSIIWAWQYLQDDWYLFGDLS